MGAPFPERCVVVSPCRRASRRLYRGSSSVTGAARRVVSESTGWCRRAPPRTGAAVGCQGYLPSRSTSFHTASISSGVASWILRPRSSKTASSGVKRFLDLSFALRPYNSRASRPFCGQSLIGFASLACFALRPCEESGRTTARGEGRACLARPEGRAYLRARPKGQAYRVGHDGSGTRVRATSRG